MRARVKERPRASRGEAAFRAQIERVVETYASAQATRVRRPAPSVKATRDRLTLAEATKQFQLTYVRAALDEYRSGDRWNISAAATSLGVSRSFLYHFLEEFPSVQRRGNQRKRGR